MNDKENKDVVKKPLTEATKSSEVPISLDMGSMQSLDVSKLNQEQQQALQLKLNEAKIDLAASAKKAQIDLEVTKSKMDLHSEMSKNASEDGTAYTGTDSFDSSIGRIEMVVGNTERAAKGKMTRSGAGMEDISMKVIITVGIVIVILALILGG